MAVIARVTTWSDGQTLSAAALNGEFNNILNDYNGGITNANISASAGITESKLTFSGSGHGHTGGTDGKTITKTVTYGAFVSGTATVTNDVGINPRVRAATTVTRISAYSRTAPVGSSLTVRVQNVTQAVTVATLSITTGNNSNTSTSITSASLTSGDILRYDITAIGSGTAGANVTIQIDGTE